MAQPRPRPHALSELQVDPARGLEPAEALARLSRYGPNLLAPERRRRVWLRWLRPLNDPMVLILLGAGLIFLALGQRRDATIMLVAILPIILVDVVLEVRAERTLQRLAELASPRATVRRSGRASQIPAEGVVPGDVLLLKEGDVVPADGVVESESNLQVDESALTGESLPVSKRGTGWPPSAAAVADPDCQVYAGTTVLAGRATVVVRSTGAATEYGRIGALAAQVGPASTPIQRTIAGLVRTLGVAAAALSAGVAAVELARGSGWANALLAAVSLAVAAIPEEFAIVFALFLTLGAWRMARRNALVRRLAGVETLGSTTVICTDKTGTLTRGRLSVGAIFTPGQLQAGSDLRPTPANLRLLECALLASEPHPFDPLDRAIASLAREVGLNPDRLYSRWRMVRDYPFDPVRKYVTHLWRSLDGRVRLFSKGSIEGMLEVALPAGPEEKEFLEANRRLSSKGMRVLAVGCKNVSVPAGERWADEAGMRLVGLIGFADPLREGVREAVAECQEAGVRVIMITGDHPLTAHAVAEAAGLYHRDSDILTGPEVEGMDDQELTERLKRVAIFARMLPAQKYRIVRSLQAANQVVAMTGDGINDAPALRLADLGIAMGRRGTQVAREAATMVLLDDNFGTIVEAIRQGRRIFDNLRHAFFYLITFHLPVVLGALLIPFMGMPLLLFPIHLVWLELIVHPTAALVFQADPPDPNLMRRPPRDPRQPFFSPGTWIRAAAEGGTILAGMLGLYLFLLSQEVPLDQARAVGIAALVMAQSVLVVQARSPWDALQLRKVLANRALIPALAATLASLALMVYVPALASAARLAPPTPRQWITAAAVALACTLGFELLKPFSASR